MPTQTAAQSAGASGSPNARLAVGLGIGGFCGLALAGIATVFANTDGLVTRGFEGAIAAGSPVPTVAVADTRPAVAGSEEFWLSRAVNGAVKPASWRQPGPSAAAGAAAVGQRFTLSANGAERTLEIVDIRSVPASSDASPAAAPMLLVTAKDVADAHAAPLRLVLEPGQSLPGLPQLHSL